MITRLLIANRGEISRRIIRTASSMGIESVAVYAEADRDAPFVKEADRAAALPGSTATETYLNVAAIMAAAELTGADAVHPGYGFLSERSDFARAVLEAGLTWVGPSPEVIDAMGDKMAAKVIMAGAGVPVLTNWDPEDPGIVYPVLVKASAGGGGKGMRVVADPSQLSEAVSAARREAAGAFGNDTVFLERYVTPARHVEIQILADDHGTVIHCFERECSIQRRHQKVVEESPSPGLSYLGRETMGAAAVAAARAVGYRGAGTVEFVVDPTGDFWFLEVNTRLQVEHPVTEAVTGVDLVREQLLVAQGLPLSVEQESLSTSGHAIEARLYAEDPASGFLPATGVLVDWEPAMITDVRWDSGVETGSRIGVDFDPMLAKVVAHAPTRTEAARRLALALARSRIRGVVTNRDFLVATLRHDAFLAGDTTTDFIERAAPSLTRVPTEREVQVAVTIAALADQAESRATAEVLRSLPTGWRNSVMPPERSSFQHGDRAVEVHYQARRDGSFDVRVADWSEVARFATQPGGWATLEVGGQTHRAHVFKAGPNVWVQGPEGDLHLRALPRFPEPEREEVAGGLAAPMPGKVVKVEVVEGQHVHTGDLLLIVEAMKMEHRVTAPHPGVLQEVRAKVGDQVHGGDILVVLEQQ